MEHVPVSAATVSNRTSPSGSSKKRSFGAPSGEPRCVSDATAQWVMNHGLVGNAQALASASGDRVGSHADLNSSFPSAMANAPTEIFFEDAATPIASGVFTSPSIEPPRSETSARVQGVSDLSKQVARGARSLQATLEERSEELASIPLLSEVVDVRPLSLQQQPVVVVAPAGATSTDLSATADDGDTPSICGVDAVSVADSDAMCAQSAGEGAVSSALVAQLPCEIQMSDLPVSRRVQTNMLRASQVAAELREVPQLLSSAIEAVVLRPLTPSPSTILKRRDAIEQVCYYFTHALRLSGITSSIAYYVFGSVHLRTVLPDGDNDVTVVLTDSDSGAASSGSQGSSSHAHKSSDATLPAFAGASSHTIGDMLPRVRDVLLSNPSCGVFVDSLVFAEVRVLKLVCQGLSMDLTVDQTGGPSTVCFLHLIDKRFGHRHIFKRTLLLLKAWANYEARILGGQGGYLGTYAFTVMLMAVMNSYLKGDTHGVVRGDARDESVMVAYTPAWFMMKFFAFYSAFDFSKYCVTLFGPMPLTALASSHSNAAVQAQPAVADPSACSDTQSDFCSGATEEEGARTQSACASAAAAEVPWTWNQQQLLVNEEFVAECGRKFGTGKNTEVAACTPPTVHQAVSPFPKAPPANSEQCPLIPSAVKTAAGTQPASSTTSSSNEGTQTHSLQPEAKCGRAPYFSSHLLRAANAFPVRNMNVMDPLRPNSNLSRGVSRAHLARIQSSMTLALEQLHTACCDVRVDNAEDIVYRLFANTCEVMEESGHCAQPTSQSTISEEDLPESVFGGVVTCEDCETPSMFCVREERIGRPEFVAVSSSQPLLSSASSAPHQYRQSHNTSSQHRHYSYHHSHHQYTDATTLGGRAQQHGATVTSESTISLAAAASSGPPHAGVHHLRTASHGSVDSYASCTGPSSKAAPSYSHQQSSKTPSGTPEQSALPGDVGCETPLASGTQAFPTHVTRRMMSHGPQGLPPPPLYSDAHEGKRGRFERHTPTGASQKSISLTAEEANQGQETINIKTRIRPDKPMSSTAGKSKPSAKPTRSAAAQKSEQPRQDVLPPPNPQTNSDLFPSL